ncbi:MAG: hypothetical protein GY936_17765 [Ignavibacteriae bacterium]|nr:hypothetical protein [Candidatus Scalindua sp.]MCP5064291.1 hypothetical protein [Ignavibacteriota bacterium]
MSQLNSLLESANPYKSLQSDAARLANKWNKTGLLEGIGNETEKNNMSLILENQAKQLVMEESNTGGPLPGAGTFTPGTGAQWAGVALPLVRKVFGQIAAKEFVSVQPMNLPSGLVFYLDFQYGTTKAPFAANESLYGDTDGNLPFGNGATGGLYGAGRFGYSINNTQSAAETDGTNFVTDAKTDVDWYADLQADSSVSASYAAGEISLIAIDLTSLPNYDTRGVKGFYLVDGTDTAPTVANQLPQFTKIDGTKLNFYIVNTGLADAATFNVEYLLQTNDAQRGDFEDGNNNLNADNTPISIPEINIQMQSEAIVAKTRKLKAVWTPEFAQDLNAYHSLDAEAELTSIMSEYISLEIDLEILDMLIESASAGTEYWSAQNNLALNATGVLDDDLGFYNSQGQWFQTLGTKMQKLSNIIHQKTLRGGANFMVCSPTVATIIESIPGFASTSDGDAAKMSYAFGVQKAGTINSRYTVYKNPYMTENTILMGFRGGQFLEAGAVFAPYIPLIMTPLVYDPETFTPRKGLLTRYAKKVVRPEFYGKIFVEGLNTL